MRIRSTKPEFWRSRRIAEVDWEARFVLKGLESYVDDNGVGKDDLELIVSDLFSRDLIREPSRTLKRVKAAIEALTEAGLLHRYTDGGTDLLYLSWWDSTQYINRPSKGRFRRPDGTFDYDESEIGSSLKSPQESSRALSAGTGEQGISESGEQGRQKKPATSDAAFDEFWSHYPRKVKKPEAKRAWKAATKKEQPEVIITALKERLGWFQMQVKTDGDFRPHASSWLNNERWNDQGDDARPATRSDDLWGKLRGQSA